MDQDICQGDIAMPIETALPIRALSQCEFYHIDELVLGGAFEIHNKFGRLMNESLCRKELAERCRSLGLSVDQEIKVRVAHDSFFKDYFIDLLVNQGAVMELKKVEELARAHESQHLHYLFITETHHGSLINLGGESVKRRFVSTTMTLEDRRLHRMITNLWRPKTSAHHSLAELMEALALDWGLFLDFRLYRDAIAHFLGGTERVERAVPVCSGSRLLGYQKMFLLREDTAFTISAIRQNQTSICEHWQRLLVHTDLCEIAWVNLNGHDIELYSISK